MTAGLDRVSPSVLEDLKARYAEPQRHYHVWRHIEALLRWRQLRLDALADAEAVLLAILFHDAIYDPLRSDNEAMSARFLESSDLARFPEECRARAVRMVEATARHDVPDDIAAAERDDLEQFLDMDLSILGADGAVFDAYEQAVRAEYAFVPDEMFRLGRRRILEGFMARPTVYFSEWGRCQFEERARINLARSIAALT